MKTLAIAALLVVGLTACGPTAPADDTSDANGAIAVETAFLEALEAGDGEAALALTTLTAGEVDCAAVIENYRDLRLGILGSKAGEAVVDGNTATVGFSYSLTSTEGLREISGTHTLRRTDSGDWLIELPDSYRLSGLFPDDVVGQAAIFPVPGGDTDSDDTACAASPVDGTYEFIALPGQYMVIATDPTGVFFNAEYVTFVSVYDTEQPVEPVELVYLQDSDREFAASQVADELNLYVERCVASGLTSADCPQGVPASEGLVSVSKRLNYSNIEIWSEDGQTWRYRASGEDFLFERNGTIESYGIYYTGTVVHDDARELYVLITVD